VLSINNISYKAQATGQFYKELFPTDEVLKLKKGAQVIMIKNDSEKRWVNGSIGTIHDIAQKMIKVKINNKIYEVKKEKWDRIQYTYDDDQHEVLEEITGSFKQFPMRLAWAITIHKSQGQTFEKVIIDMSLGSFAPGQLYVALSRCISLEGIELIRPIKKSDIIVNHQLIGFQDRLI
jgi:ATP-dependent exoDNAse (exonuclease V) alpha subunit